LTLDQGKTNPQGRRPVTRFRPDPDSLAAHAAPAWWRDAKLGVMIHWGLYSVPAWAPRGSDIIALLRERPDDALSLTPYAEWYENSLKFRDGPTASRHRRRWEGRPYADFRGAFEAGLNGWDPGALLDLVAASGAGYLIPVTKHHDGYCLWPARTPHPARPGWHAPRDLIGEMATGARARGLRFGVYYSGGLDWTLNAAPIANLAEMRAALPTGEAARALILGHYRELVARYDPDILWNDIGYPDADDLWGLVADFYNGRADRLINDRFQLPDERSAALADPAARAALNRAVAQAMATPGFAFAPSLPPVFDHRTPEYAAHAGSEHPWETVRGIGHSFGYNQDETAADHLSGAALIRLFVAVVGDGGNLLINLGPRADGSIPEDQARPLRALGDWLARHGAAVRATRPVPGAPRFDLDGAPARIVQAGGRRFMLLAGPAPTGERRLPLGARAESLRTVDGRGLPCRRDGVDLLVTFPEASAAEDASAFEVL
jgi:alpha-L-fucosidase